MNQTVADIIIDTLGASGVKRIYGMPGDSINPLVDAIRRKGTLKYIQVRHEEGGAFAASYDSKYNKNISACFGTSGPGSIHLLNGLYDAKMDKTPVIAITGQVHSGLVGKNSHQEVNMVKLFDDVSVFNRMISNPREAGYFVSRAIREAVLGRGVAHLNVPVDILMRKVTSPEQHLSEGPAITYRPDLTAAVKLVDESRKPVLLIGAGTIGETDLVSQLSEKIGAPVVYALLGKGVMPDSDLRVMGGLGMLGSRPSQDAFREADLIIADGTSFPNPKFIPSNKKINHVDLDPSVPDKVFPVSVPIITDSHNFLKSVAGRVRIKERKFYEELLGTNYSWRNSLKAEESKSVNGINPTRLARILSEEAKENCVVVTDTGNTSVWIARHFGARAGQRFMFSGGLASMGNALPGSIGIAMSGEREVISAIGDGGLAMTMTELSTIKKYNVPVKILVFNNYKLAMIKFEQKVSGFPQWGVDLVNPDFSMIAKAYGIDSDRLELKSDMRSTIRTMLDHEGPYLLEAITDPDIRPMPPSVSLEQATGYFSSTVKERVGYQPEVPVISR